MIRVLHCFHEYLNTTENWAYRLVEAMDDVEVHIASRRFLRNNFYSPRFHYHEPPLMTLPQGGGLLSRSWNAFASRALVRYPAWLEHTLPPVDVLHSHFAMVGWDYRSVARRLNIPHVISFYGFDYENLPRQHPIWRERYGTMFAEVDLFLCEGAHGARTLEAAGCAHAKIAVAPLGVNVDAISLPQVVRPAGRLDLVQVATMVEKKGHLDCVRAFVRAAASRPGLTLTLVGRDPNGIRPALQRLAAEGGVADRLTMIDSIDFRELHTFLAKFHAFIHPSVTAEDGDCEGGAPVVLLDAQAVGLPVIATTHCDIPDEVAHGVTGLLASEGDVAALAHHIIAIHDMPDDAYQRMRLAARSHIETAFDVNKNAAQVRAHYAALLAQRRSH